MKLSKRKSLTIGELMLIAATRGAIGFGAGLLFSGKLRPERRRILGLTLFLSGLASTIPIAIRVFGRNEPQPDQLESAEFVVLCT
ncbi:MAG: hypothetical protein C5B55_02730 [Blastocatellia bacterium]|nr:MAG: hypothetical protein C5B55_02730 [Blastocatellia bacterium]